VKRTWSAKQPIAYCVSCGQAETLFFDYWRQAKLRIKVMRIFNTYGPRMHPNDGRVVSNFIIQALSRHHRLWRWPADPLVLLCRRPSRRHDPPDGLALAWAPHTPLKEGLVRTIAYFEELLKDEGVRAVVGV
jgi:NAD dependent epimerase/dehydratase family